MVPGILAFARRMREAHGITPGRVLEVGSYDVNGTIRDVFQTDAEAYTGVDLAAGPGVDLVLDAHDLDRHFPPESFDTVICCECLEHDLQPWVTVAHLKSLLKPGGHLLVTTPTFGFPVHRYPIDCYRYGEDAYRGFIFAGFELLGLEEVGPQGYPILAGMGRKPPAPAARADGARWDRRLNPLQHALAALQADIDRQEADLAGERAAAAATAAGLQALVAERDQAVHVLQAQLQEATAAAGRMTAERDDGAAALRAERDRAAVAEAAVADRDRQLTERDQRLIVLEGQAADARDRADRLAAESEQALAGLRAELATSQAGLSALTAERDELGRLAAEREQWIVVLQSERDAQGGRADELAREVEAARSHAAGLAAAMALRDAALAAERAAVEALRCDVAERDRRILSLHSELTAVRDEAEGLRTRAAADAAATETLSKRVAAWEAEAARLAAAHQAASERLGRSDSAVAQLQTALSEATARAERLAAESQGERDYLRVVRRVRAEAVRLLPPGACVAVVSKGDDLLTDLAGRTGRHFPADEHGGYAGHYPGDSAEAIRHLDAQRRDGVQFLLVPAPAFWWLDHYQEFAAHLDTEFARVWKTDACQVYHLSRPEWAAPERDRAEHPSANGSAGRNGVSKHAHHAPAPAPTPNGGGTPAAVPVKTRMDPAAYRAMVNRVREVTRSVVPEGEIAVVVSKGDDELVNLGDRVGWHFPRGDDGGYAGYYPADSGEAVRQLEALRSEGADYLVIPATGRWWLDYYAGLRAHLGDVADCLARNDDGVIYRFKAGPPEHPTPPAESAAGAQPELPDDAFIRAAYECVLGRPVDDHAFKVWSRHLSAPGGRRSLLNDLVSSAEFAQRADRDLSRHRRGGRARADAHRGLLHLLLGPPALHARAWHEVAAAVAPLDTAAALRRILDSEAFTWRMRYMLAVAAGAGGRPPDDLALLRRTPHGYNPDAPVISVVIVMLNKSEFTIRCLDSLWSNPAGVPYEVIVVDNGSETGELGHLKRHLGRAKLIELGANRGFGEANNIGAEEARGELLFFLNNDALVTPGWARPLVQLLAEQADAGAVGAKLLYPSGILQEAGAYLDENGTALQRGKGDDPERAEYNRRRAVDYCSGAALMVPKPLFDSVRGFDLRFDPAYYEECDLCLRLREAGYQTYYEPATVVYHHEGATSSDAANYPGLTTVVEVNRQKFVERWRARLAGTANPGPPAGGRGDGSCRTIGLYSPYSLVPGGGERVLLSIAEALAGRDRVTLITPHRQSRHRIATLGGELGVDVGALELSTVTDASDGPDYDLFFAIGNEVVPPIRGLGRHNVFVCQFPFPTSDEVLEQHTPWLTDYSVTLVYSAFVRDHLLRRLAEHALSHRSIRVLPPPVPQVAGDQGPKRRMILHVGRFFVGGHNKKQLELIGAFKELVRQRGAEGWEFHLAGAVQPEPEHREYFLRVQNEALGVPVHIHPNATPQNLRDLYRQAAVYWHATGFDVDLDLYPERHEHFGITTLEAMSAGCVPVVVATAGQREIVTDGVNGLLWRTLDELVAKTLHYIRDVPAEAQLAMRARAKERAAEYSPDHFKARIVELARETIALTGTRSSNANPDGQPGRGRPADAKRGV